MLSPNKTIRILPKTDEYPILKFDFSDLDELVHKLSNKTIIIEPGNDERGDERNDERGDDKDANKFNAGDLERRGSRSPGSDSG